MQEICHLIRALNRPIQAGAVQPMARGSHGCSGRVPPVCGSLPEACLATVTAANGADERAIMSSRRPSERS